MSGDGSHTEHVERARADSVSSIRESASQWLAGRRDPPGLLYGAVIAAAVITASSDHSPDASSVVLTTVSVLVIYWLAHVYIYSLAKQLRGDTRGLTARLLGALDHEASVLFGGIPAIAAFSLAALLGASVVTSADVALYISILVLVTVGYLSARLVGMTGWRLVAESAGAGLFAVLIVIVQTLLH